LKSQFNLFILTKKAIITVSYIKYYDFSPKDSNLGRGLLFYLI